jgi:hypothetical protein
LLGAAVDAGLLTVDPVSARDITDAWAELMARAVQLDMLLVQVVTALAAVGIECKVLKGVANATLDEVNQSWRSYNDVDVLVPVDLLSESAKALESLELRPIAAPVGRRWARSHAKSLTLQHTSGMQVDVHRMLAAGPFGSRIAPERLSGSGHSFEIGGATVTALSDTQRFFHACYHAMLGGVRGARHRRDVLLLAHAMSPRDVEVELSDGWSSAVVAAALRWADADVKTLSPVWTAWLASAPIDPADDALLVAYDGSFRKIARAELRATHGTVARARYASALVWPSRANLAARGLSRWRHLRSLVAR